MENKIKTRYQLIKELMKQYPDILSEKVAENLIINITCAFSENDYFKEKNKTRYCYTEDFVNLVLALSKLINSNTNIHTYLLQCKRCSISLKNMEHFFYLILSQKDKLSEPFTSRLLDALSILHFMIYNKKSTSTTNQKIFKKKLLFYLIAKENNNNIEIIPKLTISELYKKIAHNESCEL